MKQRITLELNFDPETLDCKVAAASAVPVNGQTLPPATKVQDQWSNRVVDQGSVAAGASSLKTTTDIGGYVVPFKKGRLAGKRLDQVKPSDLLWNVENMEKWEKKTPLVREFLDNAKAYLLAQTNDDVPY